MIDLAVYLPGILAAYAILIVGAASPGPAVAMLLGMATHQGRQPALLGASGIAFGSATLNLLTLLGVGYLMSQAAWAMTGLRWIGTDYLLWLAWGAFRKAVTPPEIAANASVPASAIQAFAKGYALQITNPKAIAFWLAIASVAATAGAGWSIKALFVLGGFLISFACHVAWALLLSARPVRAAYQRSRGWVEGALGGFFTFAAFKIATNRT